MVVVLLLLLLLMLLLVIVAGFSEIPQNSIDLYFSRTNFGNFRFTKVAHTILTIMSVLSMPFSNSVKYFQQYVEILDFE